MSSSSPSHTSIGTPLLPTPPSHLINIQIKSTKSLHKVKDSFLINEMKPFHYNSLCDRILSLNDLQVSVPHQAQKLMVNGRQLSPGISSASGRLPQGDTEESNLIMQIALSVQSLHEARNNARDRVIYARGMNDQEANPSEPVPPRRDDQDDKPSIPSLVIFSIPHISNTWLKTLKERIYKQKSLASQFAASMRSVISSLAKDVHLEMPRRSIVAVPSQCEETDATPERVAQDSKRSKESHLGKLSDDDTRYRFCFHLNQEEITNRGLVFHMQLSAQQVRVDDLQSDTSQGAGKKCKKDPNALPFTLIIDFLKPSVWFESTDPHLFTWCDRMTRLAHFQANSLMKEAIAQNSTESSTEALQSLVQHMIPEFLVALEEDANVDDRANADDSSQNLEDIMEDESEHEVDQERTSTSSTINVDPSTPSHHKTSTTAHTPNPRKRKREIVTPSKRSRHTRDSHLMLLSNDALGFCFSYILENYDMFLNVALTCKRFHKIVTSCHSVWQQRCFEIYVHTLHLNTGLKKALKTISDRLYHLRCYELTLGSNHVENLSSIPGVINADSQAWPRHPSGNFEHPIYRKIIKYCNTHLQSLEIIGERCCLDLPGVVRLLTECRVLKKFHLGSFIGDACLRKNSQAIMRRFQNFDFSRSVENLEPHSLDIQDFALSISRLCFIYRPEMMVAFLCKLIESCKQLKRFELRLAPDHMQRNTYCFRDLLPHLAQCDSIFLDHVPFIKDSKVLTPPELAQFRFTKHLHICDNTLDEEDALELIRHSINLETMHLQVKPVGERTKCGGPLEDFVSLKPLENLRELTLINFSCSRLVLSVCPPQLRKLHVRTCEPKPLKMSHHQSTHFKFHQLNSISVGSPAQVDISEIEQLIIQNRRTLEMVDIEAYNITQKLVNVIVQNVTHLRTLILKCTYQMEEGALRPISIWKAKSNLNTLSLHSDGKEIDGIRTPLPQGSISQTIWSNHSSASSLETISQLSTDGSSQQQTVFSLMPGLRNLCVSTSTKEAQVIQLLRAANRLRKIRISGTGYSFFDWIELIHEEKLESVFELSVDPASFVASLEHKRALVPTISTFVKPLCVMLPNVHELYFDIQSRPQRPPSHWMQQGQGSKTYYPCDLSLVEYITLCYHFPNLRSAHGLFPNSCQVYQLSNLVLTSEDMELRDVLGAVFFEVLRVTLGLQIAPWRARPAISMIESTLIRESVDRICGLDEPYFSIMNASAAPQATVQELKRFMRDISVQIHNNDMAKLPLLLRKLMYEMRHNLEHQKDTTQHTMVY